MMFFVLMCISLQTVLESWLLLSEVLFLLVFFFLPIQGAPLLRQFDPEEFLQTVEHSGPQLTSGIKGDWEALYR